MMKQFPILCSVVVFLSLASGVQAIGLEYYGVEDIIASDFSIAHEISLKFDEPITHLDYQLDFKIDNLTTEANFDVAQCVESERFGKSLVSCDFEGMTIDKNLLVLRFITKDGIRNLGGKYQFAVNYGVSIPVERSFVLIRLPENAAFSEDIINESYYPQNGKISTDGKRIMVFWRMDNETNQGVITENDLQFSVSYTVPGASDLDESQVVIIAFVVIAIMITLTALTRRKKEQPKTEIITSVLNQDEKTVVDILKRHEGKVLQKTIVHETDFSKAKVSRLVKELKSRNVLEIEPVSGRENRIILKDFEEKPKKESNNNSENSS